MYCKKCGYKIMDDAYFCENCGTPVTRRADIPIGPETPGKMKTEDKVSKKPRRKGLKSVAVAFAVAAVILLLVCTTIGPNLSTVSYLDTEKGTALTEEEAECILLSDISDEDWEVFETCNAKACEIAAKYSNVNGYVAEEDTETVLNAVAKYVDGLYEDGKVSYYYADTEQLYWEYTCGLGAVYEPALEGDASGSGGEISLDLLTVDSFSDDGSYGFGDLPAIDIGSDIQSRLSSADSYDFADIEVSMESLRDDGDDDGVTIKNLLSLSGAYQFLLWQGHGGCTHYLGSNTLYLVTRSPATKEDLEIEIGGLNVRDVKAVLEQTEEGLWGVTPSFVTQYLSISLDDGMVYLSACKSGYTDDFAEIFQGMGAKVVFVNTNKVKISYTATMMMLVLEYMMAEKDDIYHTAGEALQLANAKYRQVVLDNGGLDIKNDNGEITATYETFDDFIEQAQNGAQTEIRGEENYTLVSCIHGGIDFDDNITKEDQTEIISNLKVRLTSDDGASKEYPLEEADFFINKLEAGEYTLELYESGEKISEKALTVEEHRRTEITLPYLSKVDLTGYVYDEEGNPLSDVAVSAESLADEALSVYTPSLYETTTDETGAYTFTVLTDTHYTLTYSKDGYTTVENTFEGADSSQFGTTIEQDDVILEANELTGIVVDAESGEALSGVSVSVYGTSPDTLAVRPNTTTASDGSFSLPISWEGDYSVDFEFEGYESTSVTGNIGEAGSVDLGTISLATLTEEDEEGLSSGVYAYATSVEEFTKGDPWTTSSADMDPEAALYEPDNDSVTLGGGGSIVLAFDVDICDGDGIDIYVYEVGQAVESTLVEVSNDLVNWVSVGNAEGSLSGVDINGMIPKGATYRYVRLTDLYDAADSGIWPGADINAVAIVNYK